MLYSWQTQHSSRFDNHELDSETHIGQRSDCGKDMPKWNTNKHIKYHDIESRNWRTNGKRQSKTSSQRLWAVERSAWKEEKKVWLWVVEDKQQHKESNKPTETPAKEAVETSSNMLTETSQHVWDSKKGSIEDNAKNNEAWKEEEEDDSNTTTSSETRHCVWEKLKGKAKAAAAAMKVKKTTKAEWWAEAKICVALPHERETMKKLQTTMLHSSCYRRIWDQCTEVNELKNWFAISKATDGMRYYCLKRGGMTKKRYGRNIINTFSWVQGNTTTNTELVFYWTRSGSKE